MDVGISNRSILVVIEKLEKLTDRKKGFPLYSDKKAYLDLFLVNF